MICRFTLLEKPFDNHFPNKLKKEKSDLDFLWEEDILENVFKLINLFS